MRKSKSGFTITELVVVIVVIGILASFIVVSYGNTQARARDARRRSDIQNIAKALELYYNDNGSYPTTSGTNSSLGPNWFSSDTTSWSTFASLLTNQITTLPTDPVNSAGGTIGSYKYNYGYYGSQGGYCGAPSGQMYILVYRLEASNNEKYNDGACPSNDLGDSYYTTYDSSYYRVIK